MKQYLLFAGRTNTTASGVHGFVGDFDSFTEAFVSLVDRQTLSEWWHILDTKTGEVVERKHLKVHNGMIGFERSHWIAAQPAKEDPIALPAPVAATSEPKLPEIDSIEADLQAVLTNGLKNSPAKGANGKANGAAAEH